MKYSTLEMAKDTMELLDKLGWKEQRQLHIIGISMGGMIAQELVKLSALISELNFLKSVIGASDPRKNRLSISDINRRTFSK